MGSLKGSFIFDRRRTSKPTLLPQRRAALRQTASQFCCQTFATFAMPRRFPSEVVQNLSPLIEAASSTCSVFNHDPSTPDQLSCLRNKLPVPQVERFSQRYVLMKPGRLKESNPQKTSLSKCPFVTEFLLTRDNREATDVVRFTRLERV